MLKSVLVLGGGSAGFLSAITLRARLPGVAVTLIRSAQIGIIGVGEGSTVGFTNFLHKYLRIEHDAFFRMAQPSWKLGLKFLWGPRPQFFYTFITSQLTGRAPGLSRLKAFYCGDEMGCEDPVAALMAHDRVFERLPNGNMGIHETLAYHFENEKFVRFLEEYAAGLGVRVLDDTVVAVRLDDNGVAELSLGSGQSVSADLYLDCSGFVSLLLGKALAEPFVSYASSLACDRAVVGGWERDREPIKPYTTCETMPSGWCWQIEHEHRINRGYVYASAFISDEQAEREFRAQNPKVGPTRIVKFMSGRYERTWVKNVVAIGNAGGFVEPLEATALGVIAIQDLLLADSLLDCGGRVTPTRRRLYNRHVARFWDNIRSFLAVHYRFNTRLTSPFWQYCCQKTDLAGAQELVEVYQENGPTTFWAPSLIDEANQFGFAGHFAMLIGQKVPYHTEWAPNEQELRAWQALCEQHRQRGTGGFTVEEALAVVRSPRWQWPRPSTPRPAGGLGSR